MNPILLLEINEIPWRLLNRYRDKEKYPNIETFFHNASLYTSITVDEGELSPWVTWPTIHRGLPNVEHRVFNLGQDPATFRGTPIWDEFLKLGASVGIFGSLQSWPPKNPGPSGFFIPDTFAHDEQCIPEYLIPIQRFNLDQVAKNGRVVASNPVMSAMNPKFIWALFRSGVRATTIVRLVLQLFSEIFDKSKTARRSIFQGVLFWDIFRKLYKYEAPPAFATFFTNHVAAAMHRYWHHVFPEDFPKEMRPEKALHQSTLDFAFKVLDEMLADVLQWMQKNPNLTVIFATSMGQDAVIRDEHHGYELTVTDIKKLMHAMGAEEGSYINLLAMAPQSAVEIANIDTRKKVIKNLTTVKSLSGMPLFSVKEIGPSLSISIKVPPKSDCQSGLLFSPEGKKISMHEIGVRAWEIEAGTAYHVPEGIFAVTGLGKQKFSEITEQKNIPANEIKHKLMQVAGIG